MSSPRTSREIRRKFLDFYAGRGHRVVPSSSVIPHGDPTLLFTNAGMNQFKDVFLGREKREYVRAATCQKCIRAGGKHNDLDNVGYTARHLTFFEMLGNFSFGDYFKEEAIRSAWELLTAGYGLDPDRLWVTVYKDDEEARAIWRDEIGVRPERIVGLGEKDNYWSMGDVGPCGPCSEILVDRGEKHSCGPKCGIGSCDCDRFFEIWNLVFMQYNQGADGKKTPLPRPSIDTGMGLERLSMVLQGVESVYETDLLRGLIGRVEEITGKPYDAGPAGVPHRVMADHIRSLVFAFADGAEPSNEGRGYVLRRILRRAARYARKISGPGQLFLARLAKEVVSNMGDDYPEIRERAPYIERLIAAEEERFDRTLDDGIRRFEDVVGELKKRGETTIPGSEVFFLYDSCGFPVDLVERMAAEIGFAVDLPGYQAEMERQKERSRGSGKFKAAVSEGSLPVAEFPETSFTGYRSHREEAELLGAARSDARWEVLLSHTPFYGEGGGQVGDTGEIRGEGFALRVEDTRKDRGRFIHLARLAEGEADRVRPGAVVRAEIDAARRRSIERNHTATHLLHAALRQVIGTHLHQKGSLVEPGRLRFDVTHFEAIKPAEVARVEELVLGQVTGDVPITTFETSHAEALKLGAMALFGEKYGDRVRVVKIGDFSVELCGGTHVERTGEIGEFGVVGEGSVSAGVRRLEAVTAEAALRRSQDNARLVAELAGRLKCPPEAIADRVDKLLAAVREAQKSGGKPKAAAAGDLPGLERERIPGPGGEVSIVTGVLAGVSAEEALSVFDREKAREPRTAAILIATGGEKLQVLVAVTPALAKAGVDAREVFQAGAADLGARGGGRPEMVRGSGSLPGGAGGGLRKMLDRLKEELRKGK